MKQEQDNNITDSTPKATHMPSALDKKDKDAIKANLTMIKQTTMSTSVENSEANTPYVVRTTSL